LSEGSVLARFESGDLEVLQKIMDVFNAGNSVQYDGSLHIGQEISDYSGYTNDEGLLDSDSDKSSTDDTNSDDAELDSNG